MKFRLSLFIINIFFSTLFLFSCDDKDISIAEKYVREKDYKNAKLYLEKASQKYRTNTTILINLAKIYDKLDELNNSISTYERLYELDKNNEKYKQILIIKYLKYSDKVYKIKKNEIYPIRILKKAVNRFPESIELNVKLGKYYYYNKNFNKAIFHFNQFKHISEESKIYLELINNER